MYPREGFVLSSAGRDLGARRYGASIVQLGQGQEMFLFSGVPLLSSCVSLTLSLCVPGLDYVSHEDILPYTSTDQVPIQHELFERFLLYDQTKGIFFKKRDRNRRMLSSRRHDMNNPTTSISITTLQLPLNPMRSMAPVSF